MARKLTGKPNGRPPTDIPLDILNTACQFDANANQVLEMLERKGIKINENTLTEFCKRNFGVTFLEYKEKRFDHTKLMLKQKAMVMANQGNATMLIFCLKNLCKWTDRTETKIEGSIAVVPVINLKVLDESSPD